MKFETKFKIKDKIWVICKNFNEEKDDFEWKVEHTQRIIIRIFTCCDEKGTDITYHTNYLDGSTCISFFGEQNCFATKEEAQAECDRRNNGR